MSSNKEFANLIKEAKNQGWEVEMTKGHHYKWVSPLGRFFFSAYSPSDHRAIKNLKRDLKINGFLEITKKGK